MPKIQGMFIICIILSLTEFGTDCTGYARHSQHSSWHVGSPGCDQFAELLYCSEARRALQKFAAPMLVIRKSGSKMPLAFWRDEYSLRWPSDRTELISSSVSRRLRIWNNAYYAFYVNYAIYSNNAGVYQYKQKYRGQCQFPFSYQHQLLPECSCLLLQVA